MYARSLTIVALACMADATDML